MCANLLHCSVCGSGCKATHKAHKWLVRPRKAHIRVWGGLGLAGPYKGSQSTYTLWGVQSTFLSGLGLGSGLGSGLLDCSHSPLELFDLEVGSTGVVLDLLVYVNQLGEAVEDT